jgi:dephospho-CoA kinase
VKIIGLTGGIASGKSTVAAILVRLGAEVIDADLLAREAVLPGTAGLAAITKAFGGGVISADGTLDRKRLGDLIFCDSEARRLLESLTHPEIRRLAEARLEAARSRGERIVFYMAPLLIEAGARSRVDEVWVVYVDPETQASRLTTREGITREEALLRIASQMPMEEKAGHGRYVIDNRGSIEETESQVRKLWESALQEAE